MLEMYYTGRGSRKEYFKTMKPLARCRNEAVSAVMVIIRRVNTNIQ